MASPFARCCLAKAAIFLYFLFGLILLPRLGRAQAVDIESTPPTPSLTDVPEEFESPFSSYPNLLQVQQADRDSGIFHPVIVYPEGIDAKNLPVSDCTKKGLKEGRTEGLATKQDIQRAKRLACIRKIKQSKAWKRMQNNKLIARIFRKHKSLEDPLPIPRHYSIGKYDENRVGMYSSEHYDNLDNKIDGYGGRRTVHLGIDLSAPVGTPVHALTDGYVHSVGYNSDYGDYGYVIVIEHFWESTHPAVGKKRVWALYGHLDKSTIKLRKMHNKHKHSAEPEFIEKGQIIGNVGDCHENGGWKAPHVHFQLSMTLPQQPHDMPGASSVEDRKSALLQYPDPRYVLGPLY